MNTYPRLSFHNARTWKNQLFGIRLAAMTGINSTLQDRTISNPRLDICTADVKVLQFN